MVAEGVFAPLPARAQDGPGVSRVAADRPMGLSENLQRPAAGPWAGAGVTPQCDNFDDLNSKHPCRGQGLERVVD